MIKHIVWWTLKDEAEGRSANENAVLLKEKLENLQGKIDGLVSIEVSYNFKAGTTVPANLVLQSVHISEEALQIYASHPLHVDVASFLKKLVLERQAIDYEI